jgi:ribosomal protein S12 methylthiotransferase
LTDAGRPKVGTNVCLVTLGCPKNLVDSETILGLLAEAGYCISSEPEESDIIIINTCSFIKEAVRESLQTILELAQLRELGICRLLVVCGCLPQRYRDDLIKLLPEVDLFVGPGDFPLLPDLLKDNAVHENDSRLHLSTPSFAPDESFPRLLSTLPHMAYVKIADGCSNICSYCTIPFIRGHFRSRSVESIVQEISELADMGVKEINLVAHDTTAYGLDLPGSVGLDDLLRAISQIDGIDWIRILYAHPGRVNQKLIEVIRNNGKVLPYLDLPIQHIDSSILRAMNRPYDDHYVRSLINQLRRAVPHIALRTTLMVGFPGETEKAFQDLLKFAQEIQFNHLGVFQYSQEEGTHAAALRGQIPRKVKRQRYERLMGVQAEISLNKNKSLIGTTQKVIIEQKGQGQPLRGRTPYQAPDIDGIVYIAEGSGAVGEMVDVTITKAEAYDLVAEIR